MTIRGPLLAALAAVLLSSASAVAADLGGMKGGSMKDTDYMPAMHQPTMAKFYIRGDYSHAWQAVGSMYEPPIYDLTNVGLANTNSWGLGVGYYFSKNVRGDFTLDMRRQAEAYGSVIDDHATVMGERRFGIKNTVGLFNVYYDFDTRSHFTPYLGVGLGFARNTTSAGHVNVIAHATDACVDPLVATCEATFDGATKWSAAGAVMAGFSARLADRFHIDAGYRFLYLGGARTGDIMTRSVDVATGTVTNGSSSDPIVRDMSAHEFRVGLRMDIR